MKRSWMGCGLLLVMLAAGLLVTWAMGRIHEPIGEDLHQAAEHTMLGDWETAGHFFSRAESRWRRWEHLRASLADHAPAEDIDAAFAELSVYWAARENVAFAACCMELARRVEAVGDAHGLYWWNLL